MLKNTLTTSLKELFTNRYLTVLCTVLILLTIGFVTYIGFSVHPSELQLVTHYTAFGVTHLYRDQWFYLLSFAAFALLAAFFHVAIAIKIYLVKGHPLAVAYVWLGIGIVLFAWITALAILNVWSPLQ